ncbi:MAG: hypothetical protein H6598_01940 [Flavobacteriales bacterium]|nr:hypothetical protein [Flavobacteriales bacterium]
MKFSRLVIALGFLGMAFASCTHHSSCPAYSDNGIDSINNGIEIGIESSNV